MLWLLNSCNIKQINCYNVEQDIFTNLSIYCRGWQLAAHMHMHFFQPTTCAIDKATSVSEVEFYYIPIKGKITSCQQLSSLLTSLKHHKNDEAITTPIWWIIVRLWVHISNGKQGLPRCLMLQLSGTALIQ